MNDPQTSRCDPCEDEIARTPASLYNRPGLSALSYRVGIHGSFKAAMLAGLSRDGALRDLTTRDDDDPSVALIDAWAMVLDVLTFYQERIAQEGYLRTATETFSLDQLAKAIGYRPRPGIAAETSLAFDVEGAAGSPGVAQIGIGLKVQSIPFPGERPQTFETVAAVEARAAWNRLPLERTELQSLTSATVDFYLVGVAAAIQKGDALLFVSPERSSNMASARWAFRIASDVELQGAQDRTRIRLDRALGADAASITGAGRPEVHVFRQRAALFGHNPPDFLSLAQETRDAYIARWAADDRSAVARAAGEASGPVESIIDAIGAEPRTPDWPDIRLTTTIDLDTLYPRIAPASWVILESGTTRALFGVGSVTSLSRTLHTLSGKVTRIVPDTTAQLASFSLRNTGVFAQSERIELARMPITTALSGRTLQLERAVEGLARGHRLLVAGPAAPGGEPDGEIAVVERVNGAMVELQAPLVNAYESQTVTIFGNVVAATHGESKAEVLGNGDGAAIFQKFELKNFPLTYVPAETPTGGASTLRVRVNAVLWDEAETFFDARPRDRIYITSLDEDGKVTVQFADGIAGARLPTGIENVTATLRVGGGLEGLLRANQLSLLLTRPLGVRAVTNPLPTFGAVEAESRDEIRENAPTTVLTFGRAVSLKDFEYFTASYAGVAKSQAVSVWDGEQQRVYVTVVGANNERIDAAHPLNGRLRGALATAGAKSGAYRLLPHASLTFGITARIVLRPGYLKEDVRARVMTVLTERYSFDRMRLGESVASSAIIAVIQGVDGVEAVDLDRMRILETGTEPPDRLTALSTRYRVATREVLPAQLLTIAPAHVYLRFVSRLRA